MCNRCQGRKGQELLWIVVLSALSVECEIWASILKTINTRQYARIYINKKLYMDLIFISVVKIYCLNSVCFPTVNKQVLNSFLKRHKKMLVGEMGLRVNGANFNRDFVTVTKSAYKQTTVVIYIQIDITWLSNAFGYVGNNVLSALKNINGYIIQ